MKPSAAPHPPEAPATTPIPPGSTLGVVGSGQLGRMLILAAHRLGFRTAVLSPERDDPAAQVAGTTVLGAYDDLAAVTKLARLSHVITYEFENVPVASVHAAQAIVPVGPSAEILAFAQDRVLEKSTLSSLGIPVAPCAKIAVEADLQPASQITGFPAVLKTARSGYDGKGQAKVHSLAELQQHWQQWNQPLCVLERCVPLEAEFSVIVARNASGELACYEPFENIHRDHILDITAVPASLPSDACERAMEIARAIAERTTLRGLMCIEFFLIANEAGKPASAAASRVVVNEIAPRPHNSGHLTIEAHATSQFEQQLRAVANLPLGSTQQIVPAAAMANLLGKHWPAEPAHWSRALALPGIHVHHYGKASPAPKRKLGHLTTTAATREAAIAAVMHARETLRA